MYKPEKGGKPECRIPEGRTSKGRNFYKAEKPNWKKYRMAENTRRQKVPKVRKDRKAEGTERWTLKRFEG